MKLLRITAAYPDYQQRFFRQIRLEDYPTYAELKARFDRDSFGWGDSWGNALRPFGYDVLEVTSNARPIQRLWARENAIDATGLDWEQEVTIAQARSFQPELVWFDHHDASFLERLRAEIPSIRRIYGWVGSPVPRTEAWKNLDIIFSCAPEAVTRLRAEGFRAEHLDHAFDPTTLSRIGPVTGKQGLTFIGQIVLRSQFHKERERLLTELSRKFDLGIYSPAYLDWKRDPKAWARQGAYLGFRMADAIGFAGPLVRALPMAEKIAAWEGMPRRNVNKALRSRLKPPVYGLAMYQAVAHSLVTLNMHADSSPTHASNMRLYEATGVGTCLLTDWKQNLGELFREDEEVVVYRSTEECIDKAKWLFANPAKTGDIAQAGQARTFRDHNFSVRAQRFHDIVTASL